MSRATPGYRPIARIASVLLTLLGISLIIDALAVVSGLSELALLDRAAGGEAISRADALANDERQQLIAVIQIALFLITAIVFVWWFHRAYKNLLPLGAAPLRYGTGWAVGGWFIPFFNFVRPKQVMNDIWRASDPALPPAKQAAGRPVSPLINWWWAFFILSEIAGRLLLRMSRDANSLPEVIALSRMTLATDVLSLALDVLAIEVVRRVTARQAARAEVLAHPAPVEAAGSA